MGLLVQAYPAPEVMRIHAELALDEDDVGRDQGEPADADGVPVGAGGRPVPGDSPVGGGHPLSRREEELVLAEHSRGQVGKDEPRLHAGDPRPD